MSFDLWNCFVFRAYYRANENKLPQKIVVYRDGVGAGDIQRVLDIELYGIKVKIILID